MKEKLEFESLDLKGFVRNVPDTADEFDTLAGKPGSCVEAAVNQILYHNVLGAWRADLMAAVRKATGVEPKTKPKVDAKGVVQKDDKGNVLTVVDEKPALYIPRAAAEAGLSATDLQEIADGVSQGNGTEDDVLSDDKKKVVSESGYFFGPFTRGVERGPKTPPKTLVEKANQLIAQGADKFRVSCERITAKTGKAIPADTSAEDLAWELQAYQKAIANELLVA